jgi:hypothetical protein
MDNELGQFARRVGSGRLIGKCRIVRIAVGDIQLF